MTGADERDAEGTGPRDPAGSGPQRLDVRVWPHSPLRWLAPLWTVLCLLNLMLQWDRGATLLAVVWGAGALWFVGAGAWTYRARTVVDADGIAMPLRRILWSQVAAVEATNRWSPAEYVTVRLRDGGQCRVQIPAEHAADVARIGGVPYESRETAQA